MKNYEEMSDSEINIAVAKDVFVGAYSFITPYTHRPDAEVIKHNIGGDMPFFVDYCNNPSDAWPIIMRNKISIFPTGLESDIWRAESYFIDCVKHSNPLRAAKIVFLMMRDA